MVPGWAKKVEIFDGSWVGKMGPGSGVLGPGWAKKVEIFDGLGWAKKVVFFYGSRVGKKI
jgi:hypothetical protein